MSNPASGIIAFLNVFKPPGITSAHVVARVRRLFDRAPAGHHGTLDPNAAGVLPLAIGGATRLLPFIAPRTKAYAFVLRLGSSTSTGDRWGEAVAAAPVPCDWEERLRAALPAFVGEISQVPPMVSAVKVGGRRLYDLAREGRQVERKPRAVRIERLTLLGLEPHAARLSVDCSEGTYVRTLCEDLARAIGTEGHMGALLRTRSGPFVLAGARTLDEIESDPAACIIPPIDVLALPVVVLEGAAVRDFRAGRIVPLPQAVAERHAFVLDAARSPIGVGENLGALLQPRKVFT
ncbi:MAG TPA: tRNA pseudouridine(55) synthase TruB [Candidatus Dormibacteraeota bacterium]|nr:tRNA pseudouridine(55) synthase TruB [Candidatus Dormibacteraeota bacterium]